MTKKQLDTLMLFATNYNINTIATKMKVCLGTIRDRLRAISKRYPTEFENACGIRNSLKRTKQNLSNPKMSDRLDFIDSSVNFDSTYMGVGSGKNEFDKDDYRKSTSKS